MIELAKILGEPWAILPQTMQALIDLLDGKDEAALDRFQSLVLQPKSRPGARGTFSITGGVAEIPIYGVVVRQADIFDRIFGGVAVVADIENHVRAALADASVHTILFDVDSPGGTVAGVPELIDVIAEARKSKHIVAYTDGQMASAAYCLVAPAHEIFASKAAQVGSVGVFATLSDWSGRMHQLGIRRELVRHGRFKGGQTLGVPIDTDARQQVQEGVTAYGEMLDAAVLTFRKFTAAEMAAAGEGRLFIGEKAKAVGLIDGINTYDGVRRAIETN